MVFLPRRLDKYLRDSTRLSAPAARRAIDQGRVRLVPPEGSPDRAPRPDPSVDGTNRFSAAAQIVFEDDVVLLDGHRVFPRQSHQSYLLNKPRGVTCSTRDPDGKRDLSEYLALLPDGTFPVGRLDRETTGLLLFTTDGDLATALLRPEHSTPKVYWLWLDECLTQKDPRFAGLTSGVQLHDGPAHAANASILAQTPAYTELLLTLHAGRNRQIRRMCHALDLRLVHLHRRNVGRLGLGLLPLGSLRPLRNEEVEGLWEDAGGRALVEWRRVEALRKDAEIARNLGLPFARLERWLERHPRSPLPR